MSDKQKMTVIAIGVMTIALVGLIWGVGSRKILLPKAAQDAVSISFTPATNTQSIAAGSTFDVEVDFATGILPVPKMAAASFALQFDPNILAVKEVKRLELPNTAQFSSVEVLGTPNQTNKTGILSLLVLNPQGALERPAVKVAKVTFLAKKEGTAELRILYNQETNSKPVIVQNTPQNQFVPVSQVLPIGRYTITAPILPTPTITPTTAPSATPIPTTILSPTPTLTVTPSPTTQPSITPTLTVTPTPLPGGSLPPTETPIPTATVTPLPAGGLPASDGNVQGVFMAQALTTATIIADPIGCSITPSNASAIVKNSQVNFSTQGFGVGVSGAALVYAPPGGTLITPLCSTFTLLGFPACPANLTFTQSGTYTLGCAAYGNLNQPPLCTAGVLGCQLLTINVVDQPTVTTSPTITTAPSPTIAPTGIPGTTNLSILVTPKGKNYTKEPQAVIPGTVELIDGVDISRTYIDVPFTLVPNSTDRSYRTTLSQIPFGTYIVRAKLSGFVSRSTSEITIDSNLNSGSTNEVVIATQCSDKTKCVVGGDITDDDLVDILDFARIIEMVRRDFCQNCRSKESNINQDENVDIFDFQTELDLILDNKEVHGDDRADSLVDQIRALQVQTY